MRDQGMTGQTPVPERISAILADGMEIFGRTAKPRCVTSELSVDEFTPIFEGEGENSEDVLLARIYPHAHSLALFALTMGEEVSERIEMLFSRNDFAEGSMLDSIASLTADRASILLEDLFLQELSENGAIASDGVVLGYSPGYCGWHITGQRKLFEFLDPGQIGISLTDSCLMVPLKSITGLLVAAERRYHIFEPRFGYCRSCKSRSCTDRLEKLTSSHPSGD
jgi:hypothetical protein